MEKICIVRRRKDIRSVGDGVDSLPGKQRLGVVPPRGGPDDIGTREGNPSPAKAVVGRKKDLISLQLTPEQSDAIRSGDFVRYLSNGTAEGAALSVREQADGQINLSFYFDRVNTLRLLKSNQVCEMLQISRSYLGKLVRTQRLKSHKIGGLRRFALEDIIDFLAVTDCESSRQDYAL